MEEIDCAVRFFEERGVKSDMIQMGYSFRDSQ
jgi:hypothetical protein